MAPDAAPENAVAFEGPRKWRTEFTDQLKASGRFQQITLPFMLEAGAREFCWINPGEKLTLGSEVWSPSVQGAFLYLMVSGDAMYFPTDLRQKKLPTGSSGNMRRTLGTAAGGGSRGTVRATTLPASTQHL